MADDAWFIKTSKRNVTIDLPLLATGLAEIKITSTTVHHTMTMLIGPINIHCATSARLSKRSIGVAMQILISSVHLVRTWSIAKPIAYRSSRSCSLLKVIAWMIGHQRDYCARFAEIGKLSFSRRVTLTMRLAFWTVFHLNSSSHTDDVRTDRDWTMINPEFFTFGNIPTKVIVVVTIAFVVVVVGTVSLDSWWRC